MKLNRLFSVLCILLLLTSLAACDKDEDKEPTKTDMITAHSWQGDKATASGINVSTNPFLADMFPDIQTMTLTFNRNGTYTASYTDNGQTYNASGNWEFRDNESTIFFDLLTSFGLDETLTIKELSANNLTLATSVSITGIPGNLPVEIFFVKK